MSATLIDKCGDSAAVNNVQTPTPQRETVVREIVDRESKFNFSIEPLLHCLFIVRRDSSYVAWLQGMRMRFDDFFSEFGLIVVAAKLGTYSPSHDRDEQKSSGCRQPVPKARL
jgi:hypothetical protein